MESIILLNYFKLIEGYNLLRVLYFKDMLFKLQLYHHLRPVNSSFLSKTYLFRYDTHISKY